MSIKYKQYQDSDFRDLKICMEQLQDFLIGIDPAMRLRRLPAYGEAYTRNLVKKIKKSGGLIILAYEQNKVVGCIAGIIESQSKDDLLECVPTKAGRVLELFVLDACRGAGLGKKLMQRMENYFKQNRCDIIRVEVFAPNADARGFYQRLRYSDRVADMVKLLR